MVNFTHEEKVFLRHFLHDAWWECDVRNKTWEERKIFQSIEKKLSQELINA